MLAQNFKTPADLGLLDDEYVALVATLRMFERKEVVHTGPRPSVPNGFNISVVDDVGDCGTVCCIVGWARRQLGSADKHSFNRFSIPKGFRELIMPPNWDRAPRRYTVEAAAIAIRNYLTHGEPRWDEALAS